jgi:hypothetical protein
MLEVVSVIWPAVVGGALVGSLVTWCIFVAGRPRPSHEPPGVGVASPVAASTGATSPPVSAPHVAVRRSRGVQPAAEPTAADTSAYGRPAESPARPSWFTGSHDTKIAAPVTTDHRNQRRVTRHASTGSSHGLYGPYGPGSAWALANGEIPQDFPIKGNDSSGIYYTADSPYYRRAKSDVFFATAKDAERAGFIASS